MTGQVATRILLVTTLIVTAHVIKPFSVKNITTHFLSSTRSFTFVLPDSTRAGFDHANQLAMTIGNSLFDDGRSVRGQANGFTTDANQVVAVQSQSLAQSSAQSSAQTWARTQDDHRSDEIKSAVRMGKIVIKLPTRRSIKSEQIPDEESISSETESNEVEPVEEVAVNETAASESLPELTRVVLPEAKVFNASFPAVLPIAHLSVACALSRVRPLRFEHFMFAPRSPRRFEIRIQQKKSDCDQRESRRVKVVALADEESDRNTDLQALKSILSIEECEEASKAVTDAEIAAPQLEVTEAQEAKDMTDTPYKSEPESCLLEP